MHTRPSDCQKPRDDQRDPAPIARLHIARLHWTSRFDAVRDEGGPGYHAEFVNSVESGHSLFGNLSGYLEFFSAMSTERDAGWEGTFDMGLIYEVTENLQFNVGLNIGVTRSADDWDASAGMTWRY